MIEVVKESLLQNSTTVYGQPSSDFSPFRNEFNQHFNESKNGPATDNAYRKSTDIAKLPTFGFFTNRQIF